MKQVIILILSGAVNFLSAQNNNPSNNRTDTVYSYNPENLSQKIVKIFNAGFLYKEGVIENQMMEGNWKTYYPNGIIINITQYKNDKKDGESLEFDKGGT